MYAKKNFLWSVPKKWSLRQACTVPLVYTTAYYALVIRGSIRTGDRVLIHQGETPLGQAAIAVALEHHCEVFATVRSQVEAAYIRRMYPAVTDSHLVMSDSPSMQWDIMNRTEEGMDVVFNALAADKLKESLHVIKQHGQMLETSKVLLKDYPLLGKR